MPEALVNLKAVIVVEAERRSSAVRDPLMLEMVDEVDRKLLEISCVRKVTTPDMSEKVEEFDLNSVEETTPKF